MKNIQVIDGAANSVFEIYAVDDETFNKIFDNGKDVMFLSDLLDYLDYDKPEIVAFWKKFYSNRINKKTVSGIHGTLHLDGSNCKKKYYPDGKEESVINQMLID